MGTLYRPQISTYKTPDGKYRTHDGERVTKGTPGAVCVTGQSKFWYGRYKDGKGQPQQKKLSKSKDIARRMLAKLEGDAQLGSVGISDVDEIASLLATPLEELLRGFAAALAGRNNTAEHVAKTLARCRAMVGGTRAKKLYDLNADDVLHFLADFRKPAALPPLDARKEWYRPREAVAALGIHAHSLGRMARRSGLAGKGEGRARRYPREAVLALRAQLEMGAGVQTCNHYIRAAKSFTAWAVGHLVKEARRSRPTRTDFNPADPLSDLKLLEGAEADARVQRRVLGPEPFAALVSAAERGKPFRGLTGHARAVLYLLACRTGFRASELAALKPASFDFGLGLVTIPGKFTKNGDPARLPLRADTTAMMQAFVRGKPPGAPLWPGTWHDVGAMMLRGDLAAAGIPYLDEEGQVYDFHALRFQFVSDLAAAGVHPKEAQGLARHSNISLTLDRYTRTDAARLRDAVEQIPAILPLKTGTAG